MSTRATSPPIVFIVFNRPDLTARVFERIRDARPRKLFVLADGPRPDHERDAELCAETRRIVDAVDWDCDVERRYATANNGCGATVAEGLTWVFERVDAAAVLEDDCLPDATFFPFCAEMLARYEDDERVMHIGGTNLGAPRSAYGGYSYGFTTFPPIWGWATWRRAWSYFDRHVRTWPEFRDQGLVAGLPAGRRWRAMLARDWQWCYDATRAWGHQWQYAVWTQHGLSVSPATNLISNIGFRPDATQTSSTTDDLAAIPPRPLAFPLRHPYHVANNPRLRGHFEQVELRRAGPGMDLLRRAVPWPGVRLQLKKVVPFRRQSLLHAEKSRHR